MNTNYTVYKHTAPNGKVYVGATKNIGSRFGTNGSGYSHQPFWKAILEFGWENIEHEVIAQNLSKEQAQKMEAKIIERLNATDPEYGYNVRRFGTINNDKPLSGEAYERMVMLNRSKEHRDAVKRAHFRKLGMDENSKSRREKILENKANKKRYVCFETGEIFETAEEASVKHGIEAGCIRDVCRGRYATAGGLHWCYDKDLETYTPPKGIRPVSRRVTNIETGEVFNSVKDAAKAYGVSASSLCYAAKTEGARCAGVRWEYTDGEWRIDGKENY